MPLLDERTELTRVRDQLLADPNTTKFDMSVFVSDCGTAGCIAGWAYFNNKALIDTIVPGDRGPCINDLRRAFGDKSIGDLSELFYMFELPDPDGTHVSPKQAAAAIDNYLTDGDPRWAEVLNVDPA